MLIWELESSILNMAAMIHMLIKGRFTLNFGLTYRRRFQISMLIWLSTKYLKMC